MAEQHTPGPWYVLPRDTDCATLQNRDEPLDRPAFVYMACPHEVAQAEADRRNAAILAAATGSAS